MAAVDLYFPPSAGVSIVAEPGGFLVAPAFTLAVNVLSKEVMPRDLQDHHHHQRGRCLVDPPAVLLRDS